jgi:hypothetical protein
MIEMVVVESLLDIKTTMWQAPSRCPDHRGQMLGLISQQMNLPPAAIPHGALLLTNVKQTPHASASRFHPF